MKTLSLSAACSALLLIALPFCSNAAESRDSNKAKPAPAASSAVTTRTVSGKITLSGRGAKRVSLEDSIIYFIPDTPATPAAPGEFTLSMRNKVFIPRVMAVPVGSTVEIPNEDRISHNAFSPSKPNEFDLGTYMQGDTRGVVIEQEGIVKVYCNVHYHMVAFILALNTPYFSRADEAGNYNIEVPNQPGKLVIWHERADAYEEYLADSSQDEINAKLKITKRRIQQHNNKLGESYRRS